MSALIFISGACLVAGCLYVYYGKGVYTREIVQEVFSYIAIPMYITVAMIVGGFIYEFISPLKGKKEKPLRDNVHIRRKLLSKKDLCQCEKGLCEAIEKEQKKRRLHRILRAFLVLVCAVVFLFFALDFSRYHQSEINRSVIFMMTVLAPCIFASGAYSVFVNFYCEKSLEKEISLLKKIPDKKGESEKKSKNEKTLKVLAAVGKIAILAIAVVLLVCGAVSGGFSDVMTKAVNICTECIGLG
ncbi:MAG: hypothetical protein IJA52_01660 [Clostridia bacterium]|nr:hypothetical protein [Clostridia bacterium]